jgi:ribokinase
MADPEPIDLVVCGSSALDNIRTPFGEIKSALGGSAVYASIAASHFARPGIISVVGKDFSASNLNVLKKKGIDLGGLTKKGKTFAWEGYYEFDMNEAKTIATKLNALADYRPEVPLGYTSTRFLFLANIDPDIQISVARLFSKAFIVLDTMNYWIQSKRKRLIEAIKTADIFVLNEGEARELCKEVNLVKAARIILRMGPKFVIIKKGEHGALLFSGNKHFSAAGYPLEEVKDPTGAGDSFAGALTGYLAKCGRTDEKTIRRAIVNASAVASFTAEDFSVKKLIKITNKNIEERYEIFKKIRKF